MKLKRLLSAVIVSSFIFAGCGNEAANPSSTESSEAGKKLVISTFGLSEDISEKEVYQPFEKEFNCDIVTETGNTSERYTKFSSSKGEGIDIIELSQAMAAKGVAEDMFEKIDSSKLSNFDQLVDSVKKYAEDGNGVAYTLNYLAIVYDREKVGFDIKDYNDLWNAKLEGKIAIPEITSTFGPSMVYIAGEHAGTPVADDKGEAAFKALEELKPNIVKTYSKSSDLVNMFTSGEISCAVVGNFALPMIHKADENLKCVVPESTYANLNLILISKNAANKDLAYDYLNYRISDKMQAVTMDALNEIPVNSKVEIPQTDDEFAKKAGISNSCKLVDYQFVNPILSDWIDQWNRIING